MIVTIVRPDRVPRLSGADGILTHQSGGEEMHRGL
jgi:hypothetical protein